MKTVKIFVVALLVLVVGIVAYMSLRDSDDTDGSLGRIFRAVSKNTPLFIETDNLPALVTKLHNNVMWQQLCRMSFMKNANKSLNLIDSIFTNNSELRGIIHGYRALIAFQERNGDVCPLLAIDIGNRNLAENVYRELGKISKSFSLKQTSKDNIVSMGNKIYYSYQKGVLLVSTQHIYVGESGRYLEKNNAIYSDDKVLKNLLKKRGSNCSHLVVNYGRLDELGCSVAKLQTMPQVERMADWSVMDISLQEKKVVFNGWTGIDPFKAKYLNIFRNQNSLSNDFISILPSMTISFKSVGFSSMRQFEEDYLSYIENLKLTTTYNQRFENFKTRYSIRDLTDVYDMFKDRITEFYADYRQAGLPVSSYIMFEINDLDKVKHFLDKGASLCKNNGKDYVSSSSGKRYEVKEFADNNFASLFFGDLFNSYVCKYFIIFDRKYVLFGDSKRSLQEFVNSVDTKNFLSSNIIYKELKDNTISNSSIYFYFDVAYSQQALSKFFVQSIANCVNNDNSTLNNFRSLVLLYDFDGNDIVFTRCVLLYNEEREQERRVDWIAELDSSVLIKPVCIVDTISGRKYVFAQDATCKAYLFDQNGKKLVSKQIMGPINSDIFSIDANNDGHTQILFSTEDHIHCLNLKLEYLNNYPIRVESGLSCPISIADYEGTRDYRIFVPCNNSKLYVYTKDGLPLPTWQPYITNKPIVTPIKHFLFDGKDYLVFADKLKTYVLSRNGQVRINVVQEFPKSETTGFYSDVFDGQRCFVTTTSSGELRYIKLDGSLQTRNFGTYPKQHYFLLHDIDGDGQLDYIFASENCLRVFDRGGKNIITYYTTDNICAQPCIFNFGGGDCRIGLTDGKNLYLVANKNPKLGSLKLPGTTSFVIKRLNHRDKFSLLVGGKNNYLYNYLIQ